MGELRPIYEPPLVREMLASGIDSITVTLCDPKAEGAEALELAVDGLMEYDRYLATHPDLFVKATSVAHRVVLIMRLKVIVCSVILCGALACASVRPATVQETTTPRPEPDRVVHVIAERFLFTPSQITVEAGTTLEIRLTSEDTDHGFRIVGPGDINVAIPKRGRGEAIATFEATEPGEYRFECSRVCGASHNYMSGVIRVTPSSTEQAASDGSR